MLKCHTLLWQIVELRQELECRSLSSKGLKSQLIARLTKALKTEQEQEEQATDLDNNQVSCSFAFGPVIWQKVDTVFVPALCYLQSGMKKKCNTNCLS